MADPPTDDDKAERIARMNQGFTEAVPHNKALGLQILDFDTGLVVMRLPYAAHLVGNPDNGVLHGGAITAMLDAACGGAVYMRLGIPAAVATLDLRIDYLKPAVPPKDLLCRAECVKATKNVGFVRAVAYHDDVDDPIATATGTFIIFRQGGKSAMQSGAAGTDGPTTAGGKLS